MNINKNSLQARINKLSKELGLHANVLLVSFFFDAFIARLAKSKYARNFVFKGGFYLATLLGVKNRYTADIDFLLQKESLTEDRLKAIFTEIISVDANDSITFDISGISTIREEDTYGGFSILLTGHLENIRQSFHVDIATGDPITPSAIEYSYQSLIGHETIAFQAYSLETVIAEKMQTILARGVFNSRCKDYYDIYIIRQLQWDYIDKTNLKSAFEKTCSYRKTIFSKQNIDETFEQVSNDTGMRIRWTSYAKKQSFARDVSFDETVSACKLVIENIFN